MESPYKFQLQRELQLPLNSIDFSKNRIELRVQWDTAEEVQTALDKLFAEEIAKFETDLSRMKETEWYIKTLRIAEFAKWLLTKSAIAKPAQVEYKKYCELNKS